MDATKKTTNVETFKKFRTLTETGPRTERKKRISLPI